MDLCPENRSVTPVLNTERLCLRPLQQADAPAIIAALNDFEVTKWLSVVPYPYEQSDADWFLTHPQSDTRRTWAIDDGELVGIIGLDPELGYWLARDCWGRGYGTEAGRAVIAFHFADPAAPDLTAGYFCDNARSGHVLRKLGFEPDGLRVIPCKSRGHAMQSQAMRLTRARWDHLSNPS